MYVFVGFVIVLFMVCLRVSCVCYVVLYYFVL